MIFATVFCDFLENIDRQYILEYYVTVFLCCIRIRECSPSVEMIVVTNERFIDDVLSQTAGTTLTVFDFTAYCLYGVGFEESICY